MKLATYIGLDGKETREREIRDVIIKWVGLPLPLDIHSNDVKIREQFEVGNQIWGIFNTYMYHPNTTCPIDKETLLQMVVIVVTNATLNWSLRSVVPSLVMIDEFIIRGHLNRDKHHNAIFYMSIGITPSLIVFVNHRKRTYHVQTLYDFDSKTQHQHLHVLMCCSKEKVRAHNCDFGPIDLYQ